MNYSLGYSTVLYVILWLMIMVASLTLDHRLNQLTTQMGCRWSDSVGRYNSTLVCPAVGEGEAK